MREPSYRAAHLRAGYPTRFAAGRLLRAACLGILALAALLVVGPVAYANEPGNRLLQFEGKVKLPRGAVSPRTQLVIQLNGVSVPFSGHTRADFKHRFRFHNLQPGSYVLSIYLPDDGEILQTVDITRSFADRKGKIKKTFRFSEKRLRTLLRPMSQGIVSVRQLSITSKAKHEFKKAQSRLQHHDVKGAVQHLREAVKLSPQFVEALNNLGTIWFWRHNYAKAERCFRKALKQDPHAYEPLVNLGGTLLAQGRTSEALAINRDAQNAEPNDALANAQLGLNYFMMGRYGPAARYFRRTENLDAGHFSYPQISLAEIYLRQKRNPAAVRQLESFLKLHPDSPLAPKVHAMIEKIQAGANSEPSRPATPAEQH